MYRQRGWVRDRRRRRSAALVNARVLAWLDAMSSAPGCWPSPGCRNADGYSSNAWPRKVWEALHGPIPPGFTIEHQCHTEHPTCSGGATCPHRPCGRPDHITLLTHRDNVRAAHARRKALA